MSSASNPIVGWRDKAIDLARKFLSYDKPRKQDTSWHDSMVRKATDSFTKPAAKRPKPAARKKARSSGR